MRAVERWGNDGAVESFVETSRGGGMVVDGWRRRAVDYNEQCSKALTFVNLRAILDYGGCRRLVRLIVYEKRRADCITGLSRSDVGVVVQTAGVVKYE